MTNCMTSNYSVRGFVFHCVTFFTLLWLTSACSIGSEEISSVVGGSQQEFLDSAAILGDQLSLGVGSHPDSVHDAPHVWELLTGKRRLDANSLVTDLFQTWQLKMEPVPPKMLAFSSREYTGSFTWVFKHLLDGIASIYQQAPLLSWGYLVASRLGFKGDHIYIAATSGAKLEGLSRQMDRLFEHFNGGVPSKIFILFAGNELCANHPSFLSDSTQVDTNVNHALRYLVVNSKLKQKQELEVFVLGYLGLLELVTDPSILEKKVFAQGKMTTCKELLDKSYQIENSKKETKLSTESAYFQQLFPQNPVQLCPTKYAQETIARNEMSVFANFDQKGKRRKINQSMEDQTSLLANKVRQIRGVLKKNVDTINRWAQKQFPNKRIKFNYLSLDHLRFEQADVSSTCQHLSLNGQLKISDAVMQSMKQKEQLFK